MTSWPNLMPAVPEQARGDAPRPRHRRRPREPRKDGNPWGSSWARLTAWPFRSATGLQTLTVRGVATTDSAEALRDMALVGLGIIRVSAFIVAQDIAEGRLVTLFEDLHVSEEVPVWAVTAPGRHRLPRVQVFMDFLASHAAGW